MKKYMKLLLALGILAYVVSPVDVLPGPVDDAIMILLGLAANRSAYRMIPEQSE